MILRPGTTFVYEILPGERTMPLDDGRIIICHPERPVQIFEPTTGLKYGLAPGSAFMMSENELKRLAVS